jgi:hypothetical protein
VDECVTKDIGLPPTPQLLLEHNNFVQQAQEAAAPVGQDEQEAADGQVGLDGQEAADGQA